MAEWNKRDDTLGVPAKNEHRVQQTENLARLMALGGVFFSRNMTVHQEIKLDWFQDELIRQLLGWERVAVIPKDPTKPVAWHYSAKHTCGNDDIAVDLLMLCFWPMVFMQSARYTRFIQEVINRQDGGRWLEGGAHLPTSVTELIDLMPSSNAKRMILQIQQDSNKRLRPGEGPA
jgi:hypothetical protein